MERAKAGGAGLGIVFMDGTSIAAHPKAAGASKEGNLEKAMIDVKHLAEALKVLARRSSWWLAVEVEPWVCSPGM